MMEMWLKAGRGPVSYPPTCDDVGRTETGIRTKRLLAKIDFDRRLLHQQVKPRMHHPHFLKNSETLVEGHRKRFRFV